MNRRCSIFFAALLMLATHAYGQITVTKNQKTVTKNQKTIRVQVRYVNSAGLHLRESESMDSRVIMTLKKGEAVQLLGYKSTLMVVSGNQGRWVQIRSNELNGYVFDYYLSTAKPPMEAKNSQSLPKSATAKAATSAPIDVSNKLAESKPKQSTGTIDVSNKLADDIPTQRPCYDEINRNRNYCLQRSNIRVTDNLSLNEKKVALDLVVKNNPCERCSDPCTESEKKYHAEITRKSNSESERLSTILASKRNIWDVVRSTRGY